jgi:ferredoxin
MMVVERMGTTIYYFTGTGNSLAAARQLQAGIGDCTLVPIPASIANGKSPSPEGAVGFIFPVYCAGLPLMVAEFAGKIDLGRCDYLFCLCTMGGMGATGAFAELDRILAGQQRALDAGFGVVMPGNFIDRHDPSGLKEQQEILDKAKERIREISLPVREHRKIRDREPWLSVLPLRLLHPFFSRQIRTWDGRFSTDDTCIGCTSCEKVCPAGNITTENRRPVWHHRCEMCYACVNLCPKKAIQTGEKSKRRRRYRHPDLTVRDMMDQHGRKPDLSALKR